MYALALLKENILGKGVQFKENFNKINNQYVISKRELNHSMEDGNPESLELSNRVMIQLFIRRIKINILNLRIDIMKTVKIDLKRCLKTKEYLIKLTFTTVIT